jgi:hypothetical protein
MTVGDILGKQTYFDDVIIQHQHPDWGYGVRDQIHSLNMKNEMHDRELFNKRKKENFFI